MQYFMIICKVIAISMILFKWFQPKIISDFLKNHHLIAGTYLILGSIGLFSAIFSLI